MCDIVLEEWRDIIGYENRYQVSNQGRVRSLRGTGRLTGKIRKPQLTQSNYHFVSLYMDGVSKMYQIHQLVARAFIHNPSPTTKIQVNHIDGCRTNNNYLNLEWVTPGENIAHSFRVLGRKANLSGAIQMKLTEENVQEILHLLDTTDLLHREIAARFGVTKSRISQIKRGIIWAGEKRAEYPTPQNNATLIQDKQTGVLS
jgi:predicted XRE-type DNA-binding protein